MKKKEIKLDRLNKIICIRLSNEDYNSLLKLSEHKQSNVSEITRTIISMITDMVKK
jgi:predicted DNA-binding protein